MKKTQSTAQTSMMTAILVTSVACATTESSRSLEPQTVATASTTYHGPRVRLAIGKFANQSPYMNGLFADGNDRIGAQGRQILKNHLTQSQRFDLLDRANMAEIAAEAERAGVEQQIEGAEIIITGAVTEFGRKVTGTRALGGVLGHSKTQTAYGKISVSIVDVATSKVIYSTQGAGEFELSNQQVLGFGSTAGYDATLTDKVLNLAMIEAVNKLVADLDSGTWQAKQ